MVSFRFFKELTSTMDEARNLVEQGIDEDIVVVAEIQTQGRGRRGRSWESLPGNLFMTYITSLECTLAEAPQLSFVACVAVGDALKPIIPPGNTITYKWPNDLLLNNKKVAGILLETINVPDSNLNTYLVACGLNIAACPADVRYPTTSLQDEGIYLEYDVVLQKIVVSLQYHLDLWKKEGFSSIHKLWTQGAAHIDKPIKIDLQGNIQEGIFKGLDREGAMMLQTSKGLITINAGEVLREEPHASRN